LDIGYEPFIYIKDLKKLGVELYPDKNKDGGREFNDKIEKYGIKIKKLETGKQERLENGYCYMITSNKSYSSIISFLREGGLDIYEKTYDDNGKIIKDSNDRVIYPNLDYVFSLKHQEQFLVSTGIRLYKGLTDYNQIHKVVFDIETTGLRYETSRVFAIGIRDNRGFEKILEANVLGDNEAEKELISHFFETITSLKPAIISGYNSEDFDFDFLVGRAKLLGLDLNEIQTTLRKPERYSYQKRMQNKTINVPVTNYNIKRIPNSSYKYGNSSQKYTKTEMWGISVIDIHHAAKRMSAINSDMKNTKLKYVCQYEKINKPNRTYITGTDNGIGKMYYENKLYLTNPENNEYIQIPEKFQKVGYDLFNLQRRRGKISDEIYVKNKKIYLESDSGKGFIEWVSDKPKKNKMTVFVEGRTILKNYLLDDLWETEQVDELYNQTSFMLAKMVPTTYGRMCTMGTAGIWDLLAAAWSYEHDLAIPYPDQKEKYPGGLAVCFKKGYIEDLIKIDYASLYPSIQLTHDIFPVFDITGFLKKALVYFTTTRNVYKKVANGTELNSIEIDLFREIDFELYEKHSKDKISKTEVNKAKVKQLPIKILNNSQYGAFGGNVAFKWSDNSCAARITSIGRLRLRQAVVWFNDYGCVPLMAVTDGINFQIPKLTNIKITDAGVIKTTEFGPVDEMWVYGNGVGISALINKFNTEEMIPPYMLLDNDGLFKSCLNLAKINYATLSEKTDKKTGEVYDSVKLTGNTIKSSTMPEYIEDFFNKGIDLLLQGKGPEFYAEYEKYVQDIYYGNIPLKKIARKSRYKKTISEYLKRGTDINGKKKSIQAHMELIIQERKKLAKELFIKYYDELDIGVRRDSVDDYSNREMESYVSVYMPPELELDSTIYYYNTGVGERDGDAKVDTNTGEVIIMSEILPIEDIVNNPEKRGKYNSKKYLAAFNKRVRSIFIGFNPDIIDKMIIAPEKKRKTNKHGADIEQETLVINKFKQEDLKLKSFDLTTINESLVLGLGEVIFWNRYGYDINKIWSGFVENPENPLRYEKYEKALSYFNEKMVISGKPLIKRRDDIISEFDYVLYKRGSEYDIGFHNGEYIEILKKSLIVPGEDLEEKVDEPDEVEVDEILIEEIDEDDDTDDDNE
jgi:DNA polymerase elongation subunit (family B)